MSVIIEVKNLGKKYMLRHQRREKYVALRDVIVDSAGSALNKLLHPFSNKVSHGNPYREEFWALKEVSFKVEKGDRVGVIGRNGAGKTTLLKVLSRITDPSAGRISIKGRVASLLEVGTGFHPELTCRENIYLNGAILGMGRSDIRKRFDEIISFAEVEKFLDTPVKRFSSGMYMRLAFSVAAHLEPDILLVDEVLAVGDAQFQKKCLGKMEDISTKEGRTILFVSHNMGAVKSLCNRCLLINQGSILCDDVTSSAIDLYLKDILNRDSSQLVLTKRPGVRVQVTRMLLESLNGEQISSLEMGDDISLIIEYTIEERAKGIIVALQVSKDMTPLLYSYDIDVDETLIGYREAGDYRAKIVLPMSLFKEGFYTFAVFIGYGKDNLTDSRAVLSLNIVNNHHDLNHKSYRNDRPGFLFSRLKWQTILNT